MKKIVLISIIFVASVMTSCVQKFEYTLPLALNNLDLTLPKAGDGTESPVNYVQITSTGTWEAYLEPSVDGETWCWLEDHYIDKKGKKKYVGKVIAYYENTERGCKVRGSGTVWLPMRYLTTGSVRYATFTVRRVDTDDICIMRITQK